MYARTPIPNHGRLAFFVNGVDQGIAAEGIYQRGYDIFAVVDHYPFHIHTTVTGSVWQLHCTKVHGMVHVNENTLVTFDKRMSKCANFKMLCSC